MLGVRLYQDGGQEQPALSIGLPITEVALRACADDRFGRVYVDEWLQARCPSSGALQVKACARKDGMVCGRSTGGFGWGGACGTMSWADPEEKLTAAIMIQQSVDQAQRDFESVIRKAIVAKA